MLEAHRQGITIDPSVFDLDGADADTLQAVVAAPTTGR